MKTHTRPIRRRQFIHAASAITGVTAALPKLLGDPEATEETLAVGESSVDITPEEGTILCGFHYAPGRERRSIGPRRPTRARSLVIRHGAVTAIVFSIDVCTVSREIAARVGRKIEAATGIAAENVLLCATHTHSAPGGRFALQWGGLPRAYFDLLEDKLVLAAKSAIDDLTPSELSMGETRTEGANFNRTAETWKTDSEFNQESSDSNRWLDTKLKVLSFKRKGRERDLLWYHFCAHPVCFTGRKSGPDWPGLVVERVKRDLGLEPSFLQGHCGDVNPGDGSRWLGDANDTARKVSEAIRLSLSNTRSVPVEGLAIHSETISLPLDTATLVQDLADYRLKPTGVDRKRYVDDLFAKPWSETMRGWEKQRNEIEVSVSLLRIGSVALFFHPSELFSYYGLDLQAQSPFDDLISVGYTNGFVGYLTDPSAHKNGEYAATLVPKALYLPPYQPHAAREFTQRAIEFMRAKSGAIQGRGVPGVAP